MSKIATARRRQPSLGQLSQRVVVCTWVEHPDEDISVILTRPGVYECHARVLPIRGATVLDYQTAWGPAAPEFEITIRNPPDVQIALNHWIYDPGSVTKSWYRIRNVEDLGGVGRFLVLLCSIDTFDDARSDPATQRRNPAFEDPPGNVVPFGGPGPLP